MRRDICQVLLELSSLKVYTYIIRAYAYKAYAYAVCLDPNNNPQSIYTHQTCIQSICMHCLS